MRKRLFSRANSISGIMFQHLHCKTGEKENVLKVGLTIPALIKQIRIRIKTSPRKNSSSQKLFIGIGIHKKQGYVHLRTDGWDSYVRSNTF